jgi:sec-independent protein translocase protein TatB
MFEIGFPELVLIAIVGLLVIGPERLPEALRTLGLWLGRIRRSFVSVKTEIEKEIGMDDIRRQLHNEAVLEEMKRIEREAKGLSQEPTIHPPKSHTDDPGTSAKQQAEASRPTDENADAQENESADVKAQAAPTETRRDG